MSTFSTEQREPWLAERHVVLLGKLVSMSRRDAEQIVREHGGRLTAVVDEQTDLIVVGDESTDFDALAAEEGSLDEATSAALREGRLEWLRESELWSRLGLVDSGQGVARLYTPAMLAELLQVSIAAVRQWHRKGHLCAKREVRRLPYFDFEEVRVAQKLATLLEAGCSLSQINRKLDELARLMPEVERPMADVAVVIEGSRLYIRHGESLAEPSGQLLIDFDAPPGEREERPNEPSPVVVPFVAAAEASVESPPLTADELRSLAAELEEDDRREEAVEAFRAVLASGEFLAEDHFGLAELLYRNGDFSAARERYYMAIELDDNYVEARSNLGCLLAEQGELALAEAAFRGALAYHPGYADAHYHLARLLDRADQPTEAAEHWREFLDLAPASPWADEALDRTLRVPSE